MKHNHKISVGICLIAKLLNASPTQKPPFTIDNLINKGIEVIQKPHVRSYQSISKNNKTISEIKKITKEGLILERSGEFSSIPSFHTNSNIANNTYFEQAITDIHLASKKTLYTDFKGLSKIIKKEKKLKHTVNIAILNTSYYKTNYDEEAPLNPDKGFYLVNKALVPIKGKKQFLKFHSTVIAPLKKNVQGDIITFKFKKDLLFSNGKKIKSLKADLGDGFFRTIIEDYKLVAHKIPISIFESKLRKQTYEINYTDGSSQITYSTLYTRSNSTPPTIKPAPNYTREDKTHISQYPFKGYTEKKAYKGQIKCRTFFSSQSKKLLKPVFILEGFDPTDKRKIENFDYINPNDTLKDPPLLDKMIYGKEKNLIRTLNNKGYDVIICNFPTHQKQNKIIDGGADYVERNALAFVSLLQETNKELYKNNSHEKLVILGPSMGAMISRYALAYMEKKEDETKNKNWNHNTRLWVSMDGPHLGANIPIGIQSALYLMGYIGKSAGAKRSYDVTLKSTTAKQFLINQHKPDSISFENLDNSYMNGKVTEQGFSSNSGSPFYQTFFKNLYKNGLPNSKGFPTQTRNIAIINGSIKGKEIGKQAEQTVFMKGYVKLCMLLGNICSKMHVTTIGTWNLPQKGEHKIIAKFKKAFDVMTVKATNYSTRGNFDVLSGGYTDTFNQITMQTTETTNNTWKTKDRMTLGVSKLLKGELNNFKIKENKGTHGFIPIASALAITKPERNWNIDFTEDIKNDNGLFTPFDNYYIPTKNEDHVQLTEENVAWLLKEIDGDMPIKTVPIATEKTHKLSIPIHKTKTQKMNILEKITPESKIELYPNPSNGIINLTMHKKVASLTVYSKEGEVVHQTKTLKQPFINISHLKSGIYFIIIQTQNGKIIKKKHVLKK